jgi:hypothetical protein
LLQPPSYGVGAITPSMRSMSSALKRNNSITDVAPSCLVTVAELSSATDQCAPWLGSTVEYQAVSAKKRSNSPCAISGVPRRFATDTSPNSAQDGAKIALYRHR